MIPLVRNRTLRNRKNGGCQGLDRGNELIYGYRVSALQHEKVLEISCTPICTQLTLMYGTLKNG